MYYLLELELADNPIGSDSRIGLYRAIDRRFAGLELTIDNSTIVRIQPNASNEYPDRAIAFITKHDEPSVEYRFVYSRYELGAYLKNPMFDNDQRITISENSSVDLVNMIAAESGFNLVPNEFWTHPDRIEYSGGSDGPNFLLEAIPSNIWFYGKFIIPLDFVVIIEEPPVDTTPPVITVPMEPIVPGIPTNPSFPVSTDYLFMLRLSAEVDLRAERLIISKIEMVDSSDHSNIIGKLDLETFISTFSEIVYVPDVGLRFPVEMPYTQVTLRGTLGVENYCLKITLHASEGWSTDYVFQDSTNGTILGLSDTDYDIDDAVVYVCNELAELP